MATPIASNGDYEIEDNLMKYILAGMLYLFAQMASAADSTGSYAIWGAGQKSCFRYSNTRNADDDRSYRFYLMGYLTAYNMHTPETYRISGRIISAYSK